MENKNIVSENMSLGNTLIRKGYLLAGVMMAANMLVGNEMKAMNNKENNMDTTEEEIKYNIDYQGTENKDQNYLNNTEENDLSLKKKVLSFVGWVSYYSLSYENYINLISGVIFSGANNYFKLWNYDAGGYCNLRIGCFGWRSGRLIKDIFQIGINLNLGRGILWLIATCFFSSEYLRRRNSIDYIPNTAAVIMKSWNIIEVRDDNFAARCILFLFLSSFQGFASMPLAIHISNFSIAISLDSMIWGITGFFLDKGKNNEKEKKEDNDVQLAEEKEDSEVQSKDEDIESKKSQSSEENDN